MMMMGLKFMGDVPFREVYITGLIRDEHGEKMSKSKGNVIDPLDIVDGIALEALVAKRTSGLMQPQLKRPASRRPRASSSREASRPTAPTRCASPSPRSPAPSRDINFDLGPRRRLPQLLQQAVERRALRADDGRRSAGDLVGEAELSVADRWIVSRFAATLAAGRQRAAPNTASTWRPAALYEFTWYEFCDWYLELTKPVLQGETPPRRRSAARAARCVTTLEALLRALHPDDAVHHRGDLAARASAGRAAAAAANRRATIKTPDMLMLAPLPGRHRLRRRCRGRSEVALDEAVHPRRCARSAARWTSRRRARSRCCCRTPARAMPALVGRALRLCWRASRASKACDSSPPAKPRRESATAVVGELTLLVPMAGPDRRRRPRSSACGKRIAKNESDIGKLDGQARQREFRAQRAARSGGRRSRARRRAQGAEREPRARSSSGAALGGELDASGRARSIRPGVNSPPRRRTRRPRPRHPRQARGGAPRARLPAGARPPAHRRRARRRQDHAGACAGARAGPRLAARAVHQRPAARGHHRRVGVRREPRRILVPERPDVHAAAARGRGQSRQPQDAERAARSHGRTPGQRRRHHLPRCPIRSSWSPRRIRSSSSARSGCPSRSSTAS